MANIEVQMEVVPFHHYVGTRNLDQIATRRDRICVLNILGAESRLVTPMSHVFSGGNVVFGTSPGRSGHKLATTIGDIPVYNDVREGLAQGHSFDTGVVYLPPLAVRDGVAELTRVNPTLKKIIIVTEKVSIHDARQIRAIAQARRVDIFGANGLGVADSWNRVRIGGALGGDDPDSALIKGSVAVFSNSGNFTSTIAAYLASAGWGTTTLVSSGKDVYIHFATPEFLHALEHDERSKAAVLYVEPGGYYEENLRSNKPVIACVVGRWKAKLSRAVGHAGAMAGSGDDAYAKEQWFLKQFECESPFTSANPVCSVKGALVLNIADIPAALSAVMSLRGEKPDFEPHGDLSLKAWLGNNQNIKLPHELDLPLAQAIEPFGSQIKKLNGEIGARFFRQSMRNASGASQLDAGSQSARLHGVSMLQTASSSFSSNLALALLRERPDEKIVRLVDAALCGIVASYPANDAAVNAVRRGGNAPSLLMAVAASCIGPDIARHACVATDILVDGLFGIRDSNSVIAALENSRELKQAVPEERALEMLSALRNCDDAERVLHFVEAARGETTPTLALAAICAYIAFGPLKRRKVSRGTAGRLAWHFKLASAMVSAIDSRPETSVFAKSFQSIIGKALCGEMKDEAFDKRLSVLIGLLVTNGPGTISALGAKGAVSSDGPEIPSRVQVNKAYVGFLSHSGFAHGGNGFEGVRFLIDSFRGVDVVDPLRRDSEIDVGLIANRAVSIYKEAKVARSEGAPRAIIPGINHPVFRGKTVNTDPREAHVWTMNEKNDLYNIFHDFYRCLVLELHRQGVTPNVFCVNIDGVIAAELLALFWQALKSKKMTMAELEQAAFSIFLVSRIVGTAAEIEDHINRGRDLDMRTPNEDCRFVT